MELTPRIFTPHEYQRLAIDFMLETPRCALLAGMGLGKTVSALTVADILMLTGTSDPILVLGPMRVARDTWPGEVEKWEHLRHIHITPIVGARGAREAAIRQQANIFTVNYENIPWLVEAFKGRLWPFRTVIADESTRLKGFRLKGHGGVRTNALGKVALSTDRWVNLTGTPAANGLKDLWGQYWFLDYGARLGRSYTDFMERWFFTDYNGVVKPHKHSEREIYSLISDITLAIRPEDWFDLKDPIVNEVRVTLPPKVRQQYMQLEKGMFTTLACGTEIEVFNAAALTNKCRQVANGFAYTEHPKWTAIHDAKLDALESVVEEVGGSQILVAYEFIPDAQRILHRFKSAVDISKPAGLAQFLAGEKQLGVAHPKSMGHGIDGLQHLCNRVCYYSYGWDLELHQQILERVGPVRQMQGGYARDVWCTYIIADDTLDDSVLERQRSKREVQELLLSAMARRNG